jgi:hypothetical protein
MWPRSWICGVALGLVLTGLGCASTESALSGTAPQPAQSAAPDRPAGAGEAAPTAALPPAHSHPEGHELVGLLDGLDPSNPMTEAAAMQMLAFRELVYLPFRYSPQDLVDGRGRGPRAAEALAQARATFASLGEAGAELLGRCVDEAVSGIEGDIHVRGDDPRVLGRACLEMLGDAYGESALPFLIRFTRAPLDDAVGVLLQRFALHVIRGVAPRGQVPHASAREWRNELAAWSSWFKSGGRTSIEANLSARSCDWTCAHLVLTHWIQASVPHTIPPTSDLAEPRFVATLRAYLMARASYQLPFLAEASKAALDRRYEVPALEAWLLFDLWGETASHRFPDYFRRIVVPTLTTAIDPNEVTVGLATAAPNPADGDAWTWRRTQSAMAAAALERTTGVSLHDSSCLLGASAAQTRDCLAEESGFWQSQLDLPRWPI